MYSVKMPKIMKVLYVEIFDSFGQNEKGIL